ncbi:T9SS type B sorting domain-containing protein [Pedobacter sandarakinus]|uniref:T9SS type B sorting domain-containing protein n=1 Tax=Pedobacter sandarakinus TaxID=353156 RepID=UPI0022464D33|nr:gliding motility-associated C-terminal domain-containing protein [Pedobacter sandarakinus]MCX2575345.1 gliding motility-associated C-terminal domain-containing protein [Pedobacter sandarakinus]
MHFALCGSIVSAQECNGALGDPVVNFNFGSGTSTIGPSLGSVTNYKFINGSPDDGQYTIAKNTFGMHNEPRGWHQITNHTPNDPNGYMMVVNASFTSDIFYQTNLPPLCSGTTYEFAAWVINILNYSGIKPNVTFQIETRGGQILKTYNTGDIPERTSPTWIKYSTVFTTGSETDLVLKIINAGQGGIGNDIALDDITFRACGPIITSTVNNVSTDHFSLCEGESDTFAIKADVSTGVYANPRYQWQLNNGNGWNDIAGANTTAYLAEFLQAKPGSYQYRLVVAEAENINSPNCRVASSPISILVNPTPVAVATNSGPACLGQNIQLSATGGTSYEWVGPNFTSNLQNPTLPNADFSMAGTYTVTVTQNGCTATASTTISVFPPVEISTSEDTVTICEGTAIPLMASGGTTYQWSPAIGLSNDRIANPIASPKDTTTYTVTVSNGGCFETATITVNVVKNAIANAGADQKIISGQSVILDGKLSGDYETFYWTPSDYLDDPNSLTPTASPPTDITYTLNATTKLGCSMSSDAVFIRVYPKIVIPNTFSPNGDSVNDTWNIPAAAAFPNPILKVTNRYGKLVYESTGTFKPWDGKSNGRELPPAVYYYTIYFNEDFKTYTGWINLIR